MLRPRLGPELDPALHRVRHVVLFVLESIADPLWVGAKVFEDVWIGPHRVAKHGRLSQFAQWYRPVARENDVVRVAVGEVVVDRADDDGIEVHEECYSGEAWHFLAPQHHLLPFTERANRVRAAEFREVEAFHFRADSRARVRQAYEAEGRSNVPLDHRIQPIHILRPILGAPLDADNLFDSGRHWASPVAVYYLRVRVHVCERELHIRLRRIARRSILSDVSSTPPILARLRDFLEPVNTPIRYVHEGLRHARNEKRSLKRLKQQIQVRPKLVVVLSAPKTASTSVLRALQAASGEFTVSRAHHAQPEALWPGPGTSTISAHGGVRHRAHGDIIMLPFLKAFSGEVRFVSMVRDPIAFNVSNFTYFGRVYWLRHHWRTVRWMPAEQLAELFFKTFPHKASSVWWQREFAQTVGYDALAQPFDTELGWAIAGSGRTRSLIMRVDVPDEQKTSLLREFLECPTVPNVRRENLNDSRAPSELGVRIKAAIATRPDYVDSLLDLPSVRHFWNDAQRAKIRATWLKTDK